MRATASGSGSTWAPFNQAASSALRNCLRRPRVAAVAAPSTSAFMLRTRVTRPKTVNNWGSTVTTLSSRFWLTLRAKTTRFARLGIPWWKTADVRQCSGQPGGEISILGHAARLNQQEPRHRPTSTKAARHEGAFKRLGFGLRTHAHHQALGGHAAKHIAVEHEGDTAEHSLGDHWLIDAGANTFSQNLATDFRLHGRPRIHLSFTSDLMFDCEMQVI